MADILSGKEVAQALGEKLKGEVDQLKSRGIVPGLAIVIVGDRPDSMSYIKGAQKKCSEIGIDCRLVQLPEDLSEKEFVSKIHQLNEDRNVHGILVMRPLPAHISEDRVKYEISPLKDVDCFNPANIAKVMSGEEGGFAPCTPSAVMEILDHYGIELGGKRAVIVGRSMVVGRPLAMMMLRRNATLTICHTKTVDLAKETSRAEILVAAAGKARMIKKDMVGSGAVVIDVGINFDENGKMCGDVDFEAVKDVAGKITPVPGGVGSVTSTVLAKHVIRACRMLIDSEA
ncbi:bifunctional 5,10-methylenetetrahydrofolate dehydrogenase/5,10-methenyltetrahydrofolate cyclohydrolase [Thermosediminibacter oceani]|uniref:Bifunctional protein FolD n=1 Tax=Thermosediminibacter oceani (strain ATCC BAA-1034 / DSM 16646 / JW/IW-1228P) TaxID=555079 RepID=D9S2E1_THEOJ|nr:tetrahydrofolate dehydrogenase/cyclohydrolase catalytic domain-containing protein [Thermosediminibacter oceani]ADL07568.1 5,10-methylenetetrahydrofolate dehydrogenase (NADP+); methenyltetrahydrofolate cyclohydrolase [Thermosediminibacter oceani DSM 16646]